MLLEFCFLCNFNACNFIHILYFQLFEFNDVSDSGTFNVSNHNSSYVQDVPMPSNWTVLKVISTNNSAKLSMLGTWDTADEGMGSGTLALNVS